MLGHPEQIRGVGEPGAPRERVGDLLGIRLAKNRKDKRGPEVRDECLCQISPADPCASAADPT